jgi:hypothetical protein
LPAKVSPCAECEGLPYAAAVWSFTNGEMGKRFFDVDGVNFTPYLWG